ncbi:MAG: DNA polymerase I, partial [Candidatus Hydrogenedentes bacterium]|nr:DNA polymerase I [Candidatus Hydrogenedentota bacterium]
MNNSSQDTLYVIDGSAYVHRSYHAIRALTSPDGRPTNAVYGFVRMFINLLEQFNPVYIAIAFDISRETFRTRIYPQYKATRKETPADLVEQIPIIEQIVRAFGVRTVSVDGFEADDIMGTLARQATELGMATVLITGDKDMLQLVNDSVTVMDAARDNGVVYTPETVRERFGTDPDHIPDIFGLWGDSSDNIPGVRGIGKKTSKEIIARYGSLEAVYENIAEFKGARRAKLEEDKELAFVSRELARIRNDVPLDFDVRDCRRESCDHQTLLSMFKELGFTSLLEGYMSGMDDRDVEYRIVQSRSELAELVDAMRSSAGFAVDTETTSIDPMTASLVGISVAIDPGSAYYIPVGHRPESLTIPAEEGELFGKTIAEQIPMAEVIDAVRPVLEDPEIGKTGQNIKYDAIVLARHGIEMAGLDFDTMIASYLVDAGRARHNLDAIAARYLDWRKIPTSKIIGTGVNETTMDRVPVDQVARYACEDADVTLRLRDVLNAKLDEYELDKLFQDVEMPLVGVLKRIEMTGILIDTDLFRDMSGRLDLDLRRLTEEIHEMAGHPFNLKSTKQLRTVLFDELGLTPIKRTRSGPSTDVSVLVQLANDHPLPSKMLEYRNLDKLRNTYVDVLPKMIHPETGRIHTSFNQTVAATGRLSSSNPNLQNIPVRTELGREIRRGFIPQTGWRFVSADYSQVELRVLAHLSRDENLIAAFQHDADIHAETAAKVFGIRPDEVTPELRRRAKAVNFGIIYGMSAFRLARDFDISREEAQEFIDRYFALYKGVKEYLDQSVEAARQNGFVTTLLGRRRYIPEL